MKFDYDALVSDIGYGGGRPSGSSRSTYSAICNALRAYETATGKKAKENYIPPEGCVQLDRLDALIREFVDVRHPDGSKMASKKDKEVDAVKYLRDAIEAIAPVRRISGLINRYSSLAAHPYGGNADLIRNSMIGWADLLARGVYTILISPVTTINAQVTSDGKLTIHLPNFFATTHANLYQRGDLVPVAVLVHEYHHHLTRLSSPKVYPDEFVAHWKQYEALGIIGAMGGRQAAVASLNAWLLDDGRGYNRRFEVPAGTEFTGPEATGARYWHDHLDNAR